MARTTKKKEAVKETAPVVTRAAKKDAAKNLIREILATSPLKHNDLIDEAAKLYVERFGDKTDNLNDVKGRIGSVLDIMKKESDVMYDGGMYALKARMPVAEAPVTPAEEQVEEEKSVPKKRGRKPKAKKEEAVIETVEEVKEETEEEKAQPLPAPPLQPIAPVAPITPEVTPEPIPEEKPMPKKRGRKPKAKAEAPTTIVVEKEEKMEAEAPMVEVNVEETVQEEIVIELETPSQVMEVEAEKLSKEEEAVPVVEEKVEKTESKKPVMDMSFLFGNVKSQKPQEKEEKAETAKKPVSKKESQEKTETKQAKTENPQTKKVEKKEEKTETKTETASVKTNAPRQLPQREKQDKAPMAQTNARKLPVRGLKKAEKPLTADEKLKEAFLKKLRSLGGDYFEYYSVYLLERYSMKNGRRLEGMKISGGDHDGGIDGEIELTDKLGFKETIYIQSKNWNPEKGDEKLWIVGETLLQQFIGACACRQAKDGKQHCRGIFITTSRFTPEAKRILEDMSDKIVGYDGNDVYEAAKECAFGLTQRNGEWVLDERLLAGSKAFFNLY